MLDTGQLIGSDLAEAISILAGPFGVPVSVPSGYTVPSLQLQEGEAVGAVIDKLCAAAGLCYTDTPQGGIRIAAMQTGATIASLVHRKTGGDRNNILSGSAIYSQRELYSRYVLKSQMAGNDDMEGDNLYTSAEAADTNVKRYRPLVISAGQGSGEEAENLAEREKSTRTGKSISITYTVQGWKAAGGVLWEPGKFVTIDDDFIRMKDKMLIESVSFTTGTEGTITSLKLTSPAAYIPKIQASTVWEELKDGV
jgi:prophage tail gpP-like protein